MLPKISPQRRFIYYLSFFVFIICSFIALFFAFGYRFNYEHRIFIHSGTITIKSVPKKVALYLNGKEVDKKSYDIINNSYNINGIKPGSYFLEIKAPGYSTWEKNVSVHSGIATEFWNVVLVPQNPEIERLDIVSPLFYKVSQGGETILYSNRVNGPLNIFLFSDKEKGSLKIFEEEINRKDALNLDSAEFSPDDKKLLLGIKEGSKLKYALVFLEDIKKNGPSGTNFIYLNPQINKAVALNSKSEGKMKETSDTADENNKMPVSFIIPPDLSQKPNLLDVIELNNPEKFFDFHDFKWLNNENFYFLNQDDLYLVSLDKKEIKLILEDIKGYEVSQGNIFYIKPPENLVFKTNAFGEDKKQITNNIIDQDLNSKNNTFYQIVIYDDKRFALKNPNNKLYLYNNNEREYQVFKEIGEQIKGVQFSDDGKKLLYFNEDKIKVYYLREWDVQPKNDIGSDIVLYENNQKKIGNAMWYFNYQHVLFSLDSQIILLELDERGKANETLVYETNINKPDLSLNFRKEALFFSKESDKFLQLFRTELPQK